MYILFVDESGTHGGSHSFILGGLAVHEDDAQNLQTQVDTMISARLGRIPPNLEEYELHASEMRNAKKPRDENARQASIWASVDRNVRHELLDDAYKLIASFQPSNDKLPLATFGVVVDSKFRSDDTKDRREHFAYEVLLNKFDVMLKETRVEQGLPNRGLVVHDRRVVVERDIQAWTSGWRRSAGNVGQLRNLADVPLFADSRATRLLQLADLVAYALFRQYSPSTESDRGFETIYPSFHRVKDTMHGCVHFTPSFGQGSCDCDPCAGRLQAEAAARARPVNRKPRERKRTRSGRDISGTT